MAVSLALPAVHVFCLPDLLMASLFLTLTGECRLGFTPVGEALSRLVLPTPRLHPFCVGTVRRDMLINHEQYVDLAADKLLWLIQFDINACQDLDVMAHVISLVGWPKHVKTPLWMVSGYTV